MPKRFWSFSLILLTTAVSLGNTNKFGRVAFCNTPNFFGEKYFLCFIFLVPFSIDKVHYLIYNLITQCSFYHPIVKGVIPMAFFMCASYNNVPSIGQNKGG